MGGPNVSSIFAAMFAGSLREPTRKNQKKLWWKSHQSSWSISHLKIQDQVQWTLKTCFTSKNSSIYHKGKRNQSHQLASKIWLGLNDQEEQWKNLVTKKKITFLQLHSLGKVDLPNIRPIQIIRITGLNKPFKRVSQLSEQVNLQRKRRVRFVPPAIGQNWLELWKMIFLHQMRQLLDVEGHTLRWMTYWTMIFSKVVMRLLK